MIPFASERGTAPTRDGNVVGLITSRAEASGWLDRAAYHDREGTWSHAAVHELSARIAAVLEARGVVAGTSIALIAHDCAAWVAVFLAAARLGVVGVLANPALTPAEHEQIAAECGVRLVVTDGASVPWVPRDAHVLLADLVAAARSVAPRSSVAAVPADHPLYVQYTSGTTGRLKGAVHCHGDLPTYWETAGEYAVRMVPDDVALSVSKMFFAYGFGNSLVYPLLSGSSAVLVSGRPRPSHVAELVARHRVSLLWAVPSAYANLIADARPDAFATIRLAVSAGESLPVDLGARVTEFLGAPLLDGLGSTEIGGFCAMQTPSDRWPGTVGKPLPGYHLQVRDEIGNPLPDGTEGRLWVRGPTITSGYVERPEATWDALRDGWLVTADRARHDKDGGWTVCGRVDDIEMVGGIAVSPLEVERILLQHRALREAAVTVLKDARGASRLHAFAVAGDELRGADAQEATERELLDMLRGQLASYKVPRHIHWVDALPRTATGKLQRFRLRSGDW